MQPDCNKNITENLSQAWTKSKQ